MATATVTNEGNTYYLNNHLGAVSRSSKIPFDGCWCSVARLVRRPHSGLATPSLCLPCHIRLGNASATVYLVPLWQALSILVLLLGFAGMYVGVAVAVEAVSAVRGRTSTATACT